MTFDGGVYQEMKNGSFVLLKVNSVLDTYDMSMVDGFTYPVGVTPDKAGIPVQGNCITKGCKTSPVCPCEQTGVCLKDGDACMSPKTYMFEAAKKPASLDKLKYGCKCTLNTRANCTHQANWKAECKTASAAGADQMFGCSPQNSINVAKSMYGALANSACCRAKDMTRLVKGNSATAIAVCKQTTYANRFWAPSATQYIKNVHVACLNVYAWQYDDAGSRASCALQAAGTGMNYTVTLCP